MSTTPGPAPGLPSHPGSASKKATGHVTTPSHLGLSSPAPRSVPSPAATRKEQAIKTPINHPTTGSSQGSKTLGGTPMVQSLSQAGNNASSTSPNALGMSFGTPVGLGVDITPGQLNMATPGIGGIPMNVTLSELGMGQPKRNEDEERKAKMRKVLKRIGKPNSRFGVEGISRVARRVGLDVLEASAGKVSIAGPSRVMVDIELQDSVPKNVDVTFDTQSKTLESQMKSIGHVLLQDLLAAGSSMETKLDRFAANLSRLARIDAINQDSVNCFDALSGLHGSLIRLHREESQRDKAYRIMKKKSGRPSAHWRGKIGFALQYWSSLQDASTTASEDGDDTKIQQGDLYALHLDVERHPAAEYPALRISDTWLPDSLELPSADSGEGIPWQDPPPTLNTAPAQGEAMAVDSEQKPPDVRFTALLEPPVVLSLQAANAVLQSVGVQHQLNEIPPAWHTAVTDPASKVACNHAASMTPLLSKRQLIARSGDGEEVEVTHSYTLEPLKAGDGSFTLDKMPFSHPRQLVEALPTLRQWAFLSSLLRQIMAGEPDKETADKSIAQSVPPATSAPASYSLADLLTPPDTPVAQPPIDDLPVNIGLVTSPVPTLSISFPEKEANTLHGVSVQVLPNADLSVFVQGGESGESAKSEEERAAESKVLGRALEACGDLGVWIEWLRRRSS